MTAINWQLGEVVEISGDIYRIHSRAASGEVNLEHVRDGRFVTKLDSELATLWGGDALVRLHDDGKTLSDRHRNLLERPYASLPEKVKWRAERRLPYMRAFIDRRMRRRSAQVLEPLIAEIAAENNDPNPPSARQLSRWLKAWFEIGSPDLRDIRCIAPRMHLRGNSKDRFDPEVEDAVWEAIEEHWLKPDRESAARILEVINERIDNFDLEGRPNRFIDAETGKLKRPSLRTLYRMLNAIDADVVVRGQRGALEAERTCEPVVGGPQASRPLEQVEIDHTLLDVIVLDSERNVPLGRPWITVALDRHTRMIVGVYISFHPPGTHTVMMCLRNAIRPKTDLRERYPNIRNEWPCFGKPKAIVVDNGAEFHGRSLHEACHQLGIDIIYCPARKPRYKGKVERWFGRLARQLLHKIPGTTFSNTKQRGDYRSEKQAVMTLADLRASTLKWIVDDYSQSVHRGINEAPVQKWKERVKRHPVSMPARADELDALLSHVEDRALTRKGIELHGLLFSAKTREFRALVNRADKPAKVRVKVNPDNLASVLVEDWRTGRYIEVPSVDPDYTDDLTLAEHNMLRARVKLRLKKYERVTIRALVETRQEFREKVKELKRAKKLTSKRLVAAIGEEDEVRVGALQSLPVTEERGAMEPPEQTHALAAVPARGGRKAARSAQPLKPQPTARPGLDEDDDIASLRARAAESGIVAEIIR